MVEIDHTLITKYGQYKKKKGSKNMSTTYDNIMLTRLLPIKNLFTLVLYVYAEKFQ